MIEIINNVKVDWSKFKAECKKEHLLNRAKEGFIDFVLKADEIGLYLDSDYIGNSDEVVLRYKLDNNIKIEIKPKDFKSYTYKRLKEVVNNCNGDKFIKIARINENINGQSLIVELQEELFNTKFEVAISGYNAFNRSRKEIYSMLNEVGFKPNSPYISCCENMSILYKYDENIKLEINPRDFKCDTYTSIKNIINNSNGDKFIRITKINKKEMYIEIEEELFKTNIEISLGSYNIFNKGRKSTYEYCNDNKITVLSPYINAKEKMKIKFNCEHSPYWVQPNNLKNGGGCPKCSGICKEQAKEEFYNLAKKEGYKILGKYINNKTKILMMCPEGHIFEMEPSTFKNKGQRCPDCNKSSGEQRVANILDRLNINYIFNKPLFGMLGDKRFLMPDFLISDLNLIIEVDGEQHFKEVSIWGGKEGLEKIQRYDKLKEEYCRKFNIDIIRIADTDKELETKVINIIKQKQEEVQAFNEALEEAREHIEAETDYYDFKNYLYSFFE